MTPEERPPLLEALARLTYQDALVARLQNLRGMKMPLDKGEVMARLGKAQPGEPAGLPDRGDLVFNELCRIGVLRPQKPG